MILKFNVSTNFMNAFIVSYFIFKNADTKYIKLPNEKHLTHLFLLGFFSFKFIHYQYLFHIYILSITLFKFTLLIYI